MLKLPQWLNLKNHRPVLGAIEILKFIGPGLLVTVGFIDPGNWASNVAAGSTYGYMLLWVVTLSTVMLIMLEHNVAHLGIVSGLCLAEATNKYLARWFGKTVLVSAVLAVVATALAEILGAAIGLTMLFPRLPLLAAVLLVAGLVLWMLLTNSYRKLERWIIAFVSLIGLSFLFELSLVHIPWAHAITSSVIPVLPSGAIFLVMTVLGAVVMPHNIFLHSEIIQSRQWNLTDDTVIRKQLNYEFTDTLLSMVVGWAINSAMIIIAAATFFTHHIQVNDLATAEQTLRPLLGNMAAVMFAIALLFAGIASSVTAGMAGGSIFAGFFAEPFDMKDSHTRTGIIITLIGAVIVILFIRNPFKGLLISQMLLSVQLPFTILCQILLTSNPAVMGKYANTKFSQFTLWVIAAIVCALNIWLLFSMLHAG